MAVALRSPGAGSHRGPAARTQAAALRRSLVEAGNSRKPVAGNAHTRQHRLAADSRWPVEGVQGLPGLEVDSRAGADILQRGAGTPMLHQAAGSYLEAVGLPQAAGTQTALEAGTPRCHTRSQRQVARR